MADRSAKVFGIIGSAIGYSQSPRIYNRLFQIHGLAAVYRLFDLRVEELPRFVKAARLLQLDGFNVTIPFKEAIIEYLQKLDPIAAATGSVNLVLNRRGKWIGYNTDYFGIEATLEKMQSLHLPHSRVTIIGSGGAARTVYYLLCRQRAQTVTVYHHSRERFDSFAAYIDSLPRVDRYEARLFTSQVKDLPDSDLVVNCTPQPLTKLLGATARRTTPHLFDLRYQGTGLRDRRVVDGSYMLAVQAAHNLKLMVGLEVSPKKIQALIKDGR